MSIEPPNVRAGDPAARKAADLAPRLRDLRRELHRHPEIGLDLPRTRETVLRHLAELDLEITTSTRNSGVTAVLRGEAPLPDGHRRPVVLLRGDMDALPVHEQTDLPFRSERPGLMHACGHDLHTAILTGAAQLLAALRRDLISDVVLMFQPGEEGYDGAAQMIEEGVLDAAGRRADRAFALHVISNLAPRGTVLWRRGPIMAASDGLFVTVHGRGGHGSSPHLARDPLAAACAMVPALTDGVARGLDAFEPAALTVGVFHAGTQRNIISPSASFEATVRTFEPAVRAKVKAIAERVCHGVAAAHGVEVSVEYRGEYPVTRNDPEQVELVAATATTLFGPGRVVEIPSPIMGSEDFSRVLERVPGAMFFLGACPPGRDPMTAAANHSPLAEYDESIMHDGALLLASLARSGAAMAAPTGSSS